MTKSNSNTYCIEKLIFFCQKYRNFIDIIYQEKDFVLKYLAEKMGWEMTKIDYLFCLNV